MALSPEDLKQIIDAIKQTDHFHWIEQQMQAESSPKSVEDGGLEGAVERNDAFEEGPEGLPPEDEFDDEFDEFGDDDPGESPYGEGFDDEEIPPLQEDPEEYDAYAGEATPPADGYGQIALDDEDDDDSLLPQRYEALRSEHSALQEELAQLKAEKEGEKAKRVDAERYSILGEKRKHYSFDLEKEMKRCRYRRMSDQRFREHCETIEENYSRLPIGMRLPEGSSVAASRSPDRPGGRANATKYARSQHEKALKLCHAAMMKNQHLSYDDALEQVAAKEL